MSYRLLTLAFVVAALVSALPSAAQKADLNKSTGAPGTIYHGSAIDDVNLTSGSLRISIPLLSLPGRGLNTDIALTYNSKIWKTDLNTDPLGYQAFWATLDTDTNSRPSIGWGVGVPRTGRPGNAWTFCANPWGGGPSGCQAWYSYGTWVTNDGTRTVFVNEGAPLTQSNPTGNGRGWSFDGSYTRSVSAGIIGKDGVLGSYSGYPNFVSKVKDTNGNVISCTPTACTDTLGRTFNFNSTSGLLQSISYVESNGATKSITFTYQSYTVFYPWVEGADSGNCYDPGHCGFSDRLVNAQLLKKVTLPNNLSYEFEYAISFDGTTTGEISKLKLPTGGYIRYTYGWSQTLVSNSIGDTQWYAQRRSVLTRTVSHDGSVGAEKTWNYSVQNTECSPGSGVNAISTVTDPFGNTESHTQSPGKPTPTKIQYKNSLGTVLRTIDQVIGFDGSSFNDPQTNNLCPTLDSSNPRVLSRTTTLNDSGQQTTEDYAFGSFGNVNAKTEGGFGGASRTTTLSYLHTTNAAYADPNVHIVDRVTSQVVSLGGGAPTSQVSTTYDGALPASTSSSVIQHDYASHPTSYNYRGNPTAVSRWRNTPSGWLTTTNVFNDVGNLLSTTDPGNHTTTFSYADNFYNHAPSQPTSAFVTQTSMPQTGGVSHIQRSQFYFQSGLVAASCGQNFSGASCARGLAVPQSDYADFQYDGMNRPTITKTGDGGQTTLGYNETSLPISTSVTTKINASQNKVETVVYDGLGRTKQSQLNSDPQGTVLVDTIYDPLGRKEKVSNPYRSVGEATYGETRFCYDAQGRVVTVTPPDGTAPAVDCSGGANLVRTSYFGNQTTVTDQAGKQRRSFTDALGRLIQVNEPGGGGPATGSAGSATVNSVNSSGGVQEHNISAIAAMGSVTLSGSEQSTQSQTASATQSTGSFTVNGSEQSVQEQTVAATAGAGSVTISGGPRYFDEYENYCYWGYDSEGFPMWVCDPPIITRYWDYGTVTVTVNGYGLQTSYGQTSTSASIASSLASGFNCCGGPVNASAVGSVVYFTSKVAGASTNYSLSASSVTSDTAHFSGTAFPAAPSGSTLTGGANAQYQTVYDSGTVTVTVNQGGGQVVASANFGSSSTASTIASDLRATLNASSLLIAGGSGATVSLTSEAAGASTNYSLATSWIYNIAKFASPSFTASKSGNNMTGGSDAAYTTIYDSGTVTVTVNGVNKQVSYGQGSSTSTIASALATAIANDGTYPANASANGATVNLTARTVGTVGNGYALAASTTYNTSYFGGPSFSASKSGNFLSGGVNGSTVYDSGTVTLTIAGCTAFTVNYSNGSTRDSVAAALRSAVNANVPCTVTASGSGTSISLTSDATGSGVNFGLSWSATTSQSTYFGSPSFSLATLGMSGGADYTPGTLATPAITAYTYDTLDNLLCVEQRGNVSGTGCASAPANDATSPWRVRRFAYNSLSQLLSATNPESGAITYAYDNDGNLITKTNARNISTTHSYDVLHRLLAKTHSDGTPGSDFLYDVASTNGVSVSNPVGRLVRSRISSGYTAQNISTYDALGRVTGQWQATPGYDQWSFYLAYTYNHIGMTSQSNGMGVTLTNSFDAAGRVTQLTSSLVDATHPATIATINSFTAAGAVAQMTYGNGLVETSAFNNRLQPTQMRTYNLSTSADTLNLTYGFNAGTANNGNVASMTASGAQNWSRTYAYDELNRIKSMSASGVACTGLQWNYDVWANRTAQTTTGGACGNSSLAFAANNRISGAGYAYDAAGNVTVDPTVGMSLQWDAESRLKSLGGASAIYRYDADGRRVEKNTGGVRTQYVYDLAGSVVAEWVNGAQPMQGTWTVGYVSFSGQMVAQYKDGTTYFAHKDHLGSTRVLTKPDKTVHDNMDYLPFGEQLSGGSGTTHKFTGKERDAESGLDYFGARYYASTGGRFLSPDEFTGGPVDAFSASDPLPPGPLPYADIRDPQSINKYSYALNNPLRYVDHDGHSISELWNSIKSYMSELVRPVTDFLRSPSGKASSSSERPDPESIDTHKLVTKHAEAMANGVKAAETLAMLGDVSGIGSIGANGMRGNTGGVVLALAFGPMVSLGNKQQALRLASEMQMGEAAKGLGIVMAGSGTNTNFRNAAQMAAKYGGDAKDYAKMTSSTYTVTGKGFVQKVETHWVENRKTGQQFEFKTKIMD